MADTLRQKIAAVAEQQKGLTLTAAETRTLSEAVELMAGLREVITDLRQDRAKIKDGLRQIAVYVHGMIPDDEILARAVDSYTVTGPKAALLDTLAELLDEIRTHDNAVARLELRDLDWEMTSF